MDSHKPDPEQQLQAIRQKELEYRQKELEYKRLSVLVGLVAAASSVALLISRLQLAQPSMQKTLLYGGFVLIMSVLLVGFLVRARRSTLGAAGYLRLERALLINEMPNIFQILSLLGFLNVLLKQQFVKVVVTVVVTFLLLIYLTSRRRDMVSQSPELKDKITSGVTELLSVLLGCIIGSVVYGLASLISIQIR